MKMNKYYIIHEKVWGSDNFSKLFCIVESKEVAEDFCNKYKEFWYEEVEINKERKK